MSFLAKKIKESKNKFLQWHFEFIKKLAESYYCEYRVIEKIKAKQYTEEEFFKVINELKTEIYTELKSPVVDSVFNNINKKNNLLKKDNGKTYIFFRHSAFAALGSCYLSNENYKLAIKWFEIAIKTKGYCFMKSDVHLALAALYLNNAQDFFNENKNTDYKIIFNNDELKINIELSIYHFNQIDNSKKINYCYLVTDAYILLKEYDKARNYTEEVFKYIDNKQQIHKDVYLRNIDNFETLERKNKELKEQELLIKEKEKELEDMMSMFAHKFRSPLDAIIYNTSHEHNPKLYIEAAQTMRGLLDIFSIISTDDKILTDKIKADNQGNGRLSTVVDKTLNMILLHLLSVSGAEKIQQHYFAYSKTHGKIDESVTYKTWCDDYFELEQALQAEWEQSFSALLNQSASLEQRLNWLEQHFFKLDIIGFNRDDIQFKDYAITESFLIILINEILVNAFKYYSSETKQPVILEWSEKDGYQVLTCKNPSIRKERTKIKGSGKGHTFLSALARKTNSQFTKPKPQDDFVLEFAIPNELLLLTSEK